MVDWTLETFSFQLYKLSLSLYLLLENHNDIDR